MEDRLDDILREVFSNGRDELTSDFRIEQYRKAILAWHEEEVRKLISDPDKYSRRLSRLKRRRDWLDSQSSSTPDRTDISHTRAELSALNWAIEIIESISALSKSNNTGDRDE